MDKKVLVLKVGGSIMYDQLLNINFDLFKRLKVWYYENRNQYSKIVFVTGGGGLSRTMQDRIADNIGGEDYLHSIAMSLTQTNATILASFIEDNDIYVPKTLGNAYEYLVSPEGKTMVSGGLKVGWSTDMDAAIFADILEAGRVHKISNVDYVYTKDPKEYFDAKVIKDMTWKEYFKLFDIVEGEQHKPNSKMPLDVESAQFCSRKGISYMISGGKTLEEVTSIKKILQTGTFIHP